VQIIVSTAWSFAALADGILVTWGDPRCGGDSRMVQEQLGGKVMLGGCGSQARLFFLAATPQEIQGPDNSAGDLFGMVKR